MKLWDTDGQLTRAGRRFMKRAEEAVRPLFRGFSARECVDAEAVIKRAVMWMSTSSRLRKMMAAAKKRR